MRIINYLRHLFWLWNWSWISEGQWTSNVHVGLYKYIETNSFCKRRKYWSREKELDYCYHLSQEHFNLCEYEDVTCDDCDREMQRRLLHKHTTSECHNRIVECEYCEENFVFWATEVRLFNTDKINCESSVAFKLWHTLIDWFLFIWKTDIIYNINPLLSKSDL